MPGASMIGHVLAIEDVSSAAQTGQSYHQLGKGDLN